MERAALLLDAHYYQDHADRARVRLQELERQVEALEAECRDLQATIRDLVTRAEQRVQELGEPQGLAAQLQRATSTPDQGVEVHQGVNGNLPIPEQRRATGLRSYQALTQEITERRAQLTANQDEIARLTAQQNQPRRDLDHFQREYNSILYRLAPPPAGRTAQNRPYMNGGN